MTGSTTTGTEPEVSDSGWVQVQPQAATHRDGYDVFSDGREQEGYRDARGKAVIGVDRAMTHSYLFPQDLAWELPDGSRVPLGDPDRATVLERIRAGMAFLGEPTKLTDG